MCGTLLLLPNGHNGFCLPVPDRGAKLRKQKVLPAKSLDNLPTRADAFPLRLRYHPKPCRHLPATYIRHPDLRDLREPVLRPAPQLTDRMAPSRISPLGI